MLVTMRRRAQVAALAAITMPLIIGAMGLVIDFGYAAFRQRLDQSAADAAALAGALKISQGQSEATATAAGTTVVSSAGIDSTKLTMTYLNGARVPTADVDTVIYIQAKITDPLQTFVMRAVGFQTVTVSALAESTLKKACAVCLLDPSASPSLDLSSDGNLNVTGGGLTVNSSACPAATLSSSGSVSAPSTSVVGCVQSSSGGKFNPPAVTGVPPVQDPFATMPYPTGLTNYKALGTIAPGGADRYLNPGIYTQWALDGSGSLYLNPGTYAIVGPPSDSVAASSSGGIKNSPPCGTGSPPAAKPNCTNPGEGVTIFFTCSSYPVSTCTCPPTDGSNIDISSNGGLQIVAPASGQYQGVAIFFDRCNSGAISITSNGGVPVTGTIYAKSSTVDITSNGPLTLAGLLVAASANITANANLTVSYDPTNPAEQPPSNYFVPGIPWLST